VPSPGGELPRPRCAGVAPWHGGAAMMIRAALLLLLQEACGAPPTATPPRLVVHADGTVRDASGEVVRMKGVNWGARSTPTQAYPGGLYNSGDPFLARKLLPGANHVRLVLDYYSGGVCYTDIFDEQAPGVAKACSLRAPKWFHVFSPAI
jgi:hypothetical protein